MGIGEVDPTFVRFLLDIDRLNHTTPGQEALKYVHHIFRRMVFCQQGGGGKSELQVSLNCIESNIKQLS